MRGVSEPCCSCDGNKREEEEDGAEEEDEEEGGCLCESGSSMETISTALCPLQNAPPSCSQGETKTWPCRTITARLHTQQQGECAVHLVVILVSHEKISWSRSGNSKTTPPFRDDGPLLKTT